MLWCQCRIGISCLCSVLLWFQLSHRKKNWVVLITSVSCCFPHDWIIFVREVFFHDIYKCSRNPNQVIICLESKTGSGTPLYSTDKKEEMEVTKLSQNSLLLFLKIENWTSSSILFQGIHRPVAWHVLLPRILIRDLKRTWISSIFLQCMHSIVSTAMSTPLKNHQHLPRGSPTFS